MWQNTQFPVDLATFTKETLKGCSDNKKISRTEEKTPALDKYITTDYCILFLVVIFDERSKQAKLPTIVDFNTVKQRVVKNKGKIKVTNIWIKLLFW